MSNDDGRLLLGAVVGFGAGLYMFFKGFREFREFRVVADTPAIPIRSIPMGLVHLRGQAFSEETLHSPLTRTPCYLFKVVVEEWHSDSEGGGEWKHVATDVQSVKFYLQDGSGNVLVDAANVELDLPSGTTRKVHGSGPGRSINPATRTSGSRLPTDTELLQYVEQARLRGFGQMVGRGINALTGSDDHGAKQQKQSLLSFLADPSGRGGEAFRGQMMRAMIAKHDPSGAVSRAALELWKHPQGTPEFEAAFATLAQTYAGAMSTDRQGLNPMMVMAFAQQKRAEALSLAAAVAGGAEPQTDPEAEKARQTALAYSRENLSGLAREHAPAATGHYRLTEYCLLPNSDYDLTGTCVENPSPRDAYDRNLIQKGTNEPIFLISSRTGKQVESWLRKRAAMKVFGGAALAIVCLAILLWKAGLF